MFRVILNRIKTALLIVGLFTIFIFATAVDDEVNGMKAIMIVMIGCLVSALGMLIEVYELKRDGRWHE